MSPAVKVALLFGGLIVVMGLAAWLFAKYMEKQP